AVIFSCPSTVPRLSTDLLATIDEIKAVKLLIVEDNSQLLKTILQSLNAEDFVCEAADNFSAAHEKISLYHYDLFIVDINLPDGSGLDLIRTCKKQAPETGIIVISARNSLENRVEGLELGADDYLTKPFDMAELVARVKSVIRRRKFNGDPVIRSNESLVDTSASRVEARRTSVG